MRVFAITKNGICRIMRTYAIDPATGRVSISSSDAPDGADEVAKWHANDQAQVTTIREIQESDVPVHYQYKESWRDDGANIVPDMTVAKVIKMDIIRAPRDAELDRLDKDYNRAVGRKQTVEADAIEAKREALRNVPQTFELSTATTLEELHALWPAAVPRP